MRPTLELAFLLIFAVLTPSTKPSGDGGFARLKALEGKWVATEAGRTTPGVFELAAGGTTVVQKSGFLLVFSQDSRAINATLYTAENNQSRLRSEGLTGGSKTLKFAFVDSTNVKPGAIFASGLEIEFAGADLLLERWKFKEGTKETALNLTFRRMRDPTAPERP